MKLPADDLADNVVGQRQQIIVGRRPAWRWKVAHGKLDVYARAGVAHAWIVDPLARTLEVLQLEHGRWVILAVLAGDDDACVPPFTDITIPLASLWAD